MNEKKSEVKLGCNLNTRETTMGNQAVVVHFSGNNFFNVRMAFVFSTETFP